MIDKVSKKKRQYYKKTTSYLIYCKEKKICDLIIEEQILDKFIKSLRSKHSFFNKFIKNNQSRSYKKTNSHLSYCKTKSNNNLINEEQILDKFIKSLRSKCFFIKKFIKNEHQGLHLCNKI